MSVRPRSQAQRTLIAALLAGCALQGCAQANLLAAIDGPYVPPSERLAGEAEPVPAPAPMPAPAVADTAAVARIVPTRVPVEDLAYPDAQFVGPVLTAPEMAALAEAAAVDLPAQVDAGFLPPVETENAAPAAAERVEPAAVPDAAAFAAFHAFTLQRLASAAPRSGRLSMLLADPPSLDPALQTCGNRPPAVLFDLDPAAGLMPLTNTASADPGLVAELADLRLRGVTIYWISGHGPGSASAIRRRLVDSGLDPAGLDPLIVTRFSGESKQERRQGLGETQCLLAIVGDNRSDFDELYDYVLDTAVAVPLEVHIGNGWFLAPPPLSPQPLSPSLTD